MADRDTALLVMDMQTSITERLGDEALLERSARAIAVARERDLHVIYVRVAFRAGYPEVSPVNQSFSRIVGSGSLIEEETEIDPAVAPQPGDVLVTKRRVSAFTGSDLEVILRARQIRSLVLTGISTSGVVLSTLRQAADLDYELTVISDCCADPDPEVHRVLLEKVFPRQARVVDVEAWGRALP